MYMLPDYDDIRDALGDPVWSDGNGVPRYATFSPDMLGVYDVFALLVRIACQSCDRRFLVGCGWVRTDMKLDFSEGTEKNAERGWVPARPLVRTLPELAAGFAYADPPRHDCGGDSMTSVALEIVEAWERSLGKGWERRREVERVDVRPAWVIDDDDPRYPTPFVG